MPPKIHPIIGSRYNSLTIIGINPIAKQVKNRKLTFVECLCVCGKSVFYEFNSVKSGHSKSCGCSRNGKILISSEKQPLKSIWNNMISRCYNHRNISYKNYGYVGVEVCEEWRIDFYSFYNWAIENGWQKGLQLDKDIKGNGLLYSPDNCLFVTRKDNCNARKNNIVINFNGDVFTLKQLCDKYGINYSYAHTLIRYKNKSWQDVMDIIKKINKK